MNTIIDSTINIAGLQFNPNNNAIELFVSGCNGPHCNGCHNKIAWDFNYGEKLNQNIYKRLINYKMITNKIFVMGGEPLDQNKHHFLILSNKLNMIFDEMWLFTKYNINQIPQNIKKIYNYIKCGRYDDTLQCDNNIHYGINLASSNQIIYKRCVNY